MKKIPTLFVRDMANDPKLVLNFVSPECHWVGLEEGVATRKYDGTCCMVRGMQLYKRYDAKQGRVPPVGFEPAQPDPDPTTGHWPGWLLVGGGPEDKHHRAAWQYVLDNRSTLADDTYELVGHAWGRNPEQVYHAQFLRHGATRLPDCPTSYDALREYLAENVMEGIVWHHPDGRRAKVKARDYGLRWPR